MVWRLSSQLCPLVGTASWPARCIVGSYGLLELLYLELGNSDAASPDKGCKNASTRNRGRRCCSSQMPSCNRKDTTKGTRERHLTKGIRDLLRKADDD